MMKKTMAAALAVGMLAVGTKPLSASAVPANVSLPASVTSDITTLGNGLTKFMGSGIAGASTFLAAGNNDITQSYHWLIPFIDLYLSGGLEVAAGKPDLSILNDTSSFGTMLTPIKTAIGANTNLIYMPLLAPTFRVHFKFQDDAPLPGIVKNFEVWFKFGTIPAGLVGSFLNPALASAGMTVDINALLWGVGVRYKFFRIGGETLSFSLAGNGSFNHADGVMNLGVQLPKQQIGSYDIPGYGTQTVNQTMGFNITNQYATSVISLSANANLNVLKILQIYGGLGLNIDMSGDQTSSWSLNGDTLLTDSASGTTTTLNRLSLGNSVKYARPVLVPKFNLGIRFSILDIEAESRFDIQSFALRAGVAISI